ncbi:MAG: fasciclin domain-containing protein [Gemmatimonadales bacterium]|nr:fasciclin domain-containing protein [Gemmatimonadales bacterium]
MMKKLLRMVPASAVALAIAVSACSDSNEPEPLTNLVQTAVSAGSFETLVTAIDAAGLGSTLANDGPFTVFAPTDNAFAALPAGTIDALLQNIPALTDVLLYHVVAGEVFAADVVNLASATTLEGSTISIDASNGVMINDAKVIQADVRASNGVIHVIDKVLLPPQ